MIHRIERHLVIGVFREPLTDFTRAPAGLQQEVEGENDQQQCDEKPENQLSNKFHDLPS